MFFISLTKQKQTKTKNTYTQMPLYTQTPIYTPTHIQIHKHRNKKHSQAHKDIPRNTNTKADRNAHMHAHRHRPTYDHTYRHAHTPYCMCPCRELGPSSMSWPPWCNSSRPLDCEAQVQCPEPKSLVGRGHSRAEEHQKQSP